MKTRNTVIISLILILLLPNIILITYNVKSEIEWEPRADIPEPTNDPVIVTYGKNIYLVGGDDGGEGRSKTVFKYSPSEDNWTEFGEAITCERSQGTLWRDRVYIVDAWTGFGYYNLSTRKWIQSYRPRSRIDCAVAECNGIIYLCGGAIDGYMVDITNTVKAYNPTNDSWFNVANMTFKRIDAMASSYNNRLYVFGGETSIGGDAIYDVERYDPSSNTWEVITQSPLDSHEGSILNIADNFIITGGFMEWEKSPNDNNQTFLYNVNNNTWLQLPDIKYYRASAGFTSFGPNIYFMGGRDAPGNGYQNNDVLNLSNIINLSLLDDYDKDGIPDYIDTDDDNDGFNDTYEQELGTYIKDPKDFPIDTDNDGLLDSIDDDDDNDGFNDTIETEVGTDPLNSIDHPRDTDDDGIIDYYDSDDDGDGYDDYIDDFPLNRTEWQDTDEDGIGDNSDPDIDDDGVVNFIDSFPYDPAEWADNDGDGMGDNSDRDDDNDGISDIEEVEEGTNPLLEDTDGDGYNDKKDDYPLDPSKWDEEPQLEEDLWLVFISIIIIVVIVICVISFLVIKRAGSREYYYGGYYPQQPYQMPPDQTLRDTQEPYSDYPPEYHQRSEPERYQSPPLEYRNDYYEPPSKDDPPRRLRRQY